MTFDSAFYAMCAGARIRRADWDSERFLYFKDRTVDEMDNPYKPRTADVLAQDWEMLQ